MTGQQLPGWDGCDVADLLDLTPLPPARFSSRCSERNEHDRVYGGQMLGQALAAAARTVAADRPVSYLQFLFAAGALTNQAIDYDVTTLQEGKRFSSRNVRGSQFGGRIICDASVSFATPFDAPAHQAPPASDSGLELDPERLPSLEDIDEPQAREVERVLGYAFRPHGAIEFRAPFRKDLFSPDPVEPRMRFFLRIRRPMGDDPALHAAAFAYLSDYWINFAACIPHAPACAAAHARLYVASLNHAIWFHRPLRADQWLLFDCSSPSGAFGRGLTMGRIYDRSGALVASATQECLLAPVV
jgi:acyl-CoA thioesterase-2